MDPYDFHDLGIAIIPIGYRSKRPDRRFLPGMQWQQYQERLPGRGDILAWSSRSLGNWAVICGWQNLVIVDFDDCQAHSLWLATYGQDYTNTYTVSTGRGYHYYYFVEDAPSQTMKWQGGEVKATGYCLIPPSIHPTGRTYRAVNPDVPIRRVNNIYELLPESAFYNKEETFELQQLTDPFRPPMPCSGGAYDQAREVSILSFFDKPHRSSNGYYSVFCPFHDDGHLRGKRSAWVDSHKNRFGCHVCLNKSLGVIDFYAALKQVDAATAVSELLERY